MILKSTDLQVERVKNSTACHCLGVSKMALSLWVRNEGCPQNTDGTYSLPAVIKWRVDKLSNRNTAPGELKEEKLKKEIEFLQARINEKNESVIDRSLHEEILASRAGSLRAFFEKTFMSNAVYLAGKQVEEVRTLLFELLRQAMNAYIGKRE